MTANCSSLCVIEGICVKQCSMNAYACCSQWNTIEGSNSYCCLGSLNCQPNSDWVPSNYALCNGICNIS